MRVVKYTDLCSLDFTFRNAFTYYQIWQPDDIHDFERLGRTRNLIYYQIDGCRRYYQDGKFLMTLNKGDIFFAPDGAKYYTDIPELYNSNISAGVGVSFDLLDNDGELIKIDEPIGVIGHDDKGDIYKKFERLMYAFYHKSTCSMTYKGELYMLLDRILSPTEEKNDLRGSYSEILEAISMIETHPQLNLTNKELADMCFLSETTFLRKFKAYSGGVTPAHYRNNIRLVMAEELATTSKTLQEIAETLGFYDASHLCRIFKQYRGRTLKNYK